MKKTIKLLIAVFILAYLLELSRLNIIVPYTLNKQFTSNQYLRQISQPSANSSPNVPIFNNQVLSNIKVPRKLTNQQIAQVLGQTSQKKWIEVDLSQQKLYAHQGDQVIYQFLISSGKWNPTPTGAWRIWIKIWKNKMSGGSRILRTYYYLPDVPYIMYFYKGYGIHGAYWHNNFGNPMSHGCINMRIPDAEKLFLWAGPWLPREKWGQKSTSQNPGTLVIIHE